MQLEKAKILRRGRIRRAAEKDCECPDVPESLRVFSTKLRTVMSSIMRRRNGLMGFSLIGGSCLEVRVVDPLILKTGRPACHPVLLTSSLHPCHWLRFARSALPR